MQFSFFKYKLSIDIKKVVQKKRQKYFFCNIQNKICQEKLKLKRLQVQNGNKKKNVLKKITTDHQEFYISA